MQTVQRAKGTKPKYEIQSTKAIGVIPLGSVCRFATVLFVVFRYLSDSDKPQRAYKCVSVFVFRMRFRRRLLTAQYAVQIGRAVQAASLLHHQLLIDEQKAG